MDRWAMNFDIYPQCKPISMLLQIYQKDLDKKGLCFLCSKHINSKENRKQKFPKVCYGGNTTYVPYTMFVVYGEFLLINVNTRFILKICRCYFHKQIVYSQ